MEGYKGVPWFFAFLRFSLEPDAISISICYFYVLFNRKRRPLVQQTQKRNIKTREHEEESTIERAKATIIHNIHIRKRITKNMVKMVKTKPSHSIRAYGKGKNMDTTCRRASWNEGFFQTIVRLWGLSTDRHLLYHKNCCVFLFALSLFCNAKKYKIYHKRHRFWFWTISVN